MYTGLLHTHNLFRWLVLIALLAAIVLAIAGWSGRKNWTKKDNIAGLLATIFVDVQLLIGLILYFFVSPITKSALADFGGAMKNPDLRFYAVEHVLLMVVAWYLFTLAGPVQKKLLSMHVNIKQLQYGMELHLF